MSAKKVLVRIRKYHFLGHIQTDDIKLSSWIFSFKEMVFLQALAFVPCPRSIAAWSYSWVWALALWSLAVLLEALKHRRMRCAIKDVLDVAEDV